MALEMLERISTCVTAKEIDFLVYTMRFQDHLGVVKGITRREVCNALGIHKSKFYSILQSLEQKSIIRIFWSEKREGFWTFSIIDNSFVGKESYKKGYINLNTKFLWTEEFLVLNRNEKLICLKILALYREHRNKITLRLKTLSEWTGATLQSVKKYVSSIEAVFGKIEIEYGTILIDLKSCYDAFSRMFKSESDTHNEHLIKYILAAKKADYFCDKDFRDTLNVFKALGGKFGFNAVVTAVLNSVEHHRRLIPKYINKMTRLVGRHPVMVALFY